MISSIAGSNVSGTLTDLQQVRKAEAAPAAAVKTTPSAASAAVVSPNRDQVDISEGGQAYVSAQERTSSEKEEASTAKSDNKALFDSLHKADKTGTSWVQQQKAAMKAGLSAADFMSQPTKSSGKTASTTDTSADALASLLSSYTEGRQSATVLRTAGETALTGAADSTATNAATGSTSAADKVDTKKLSQYSEQQLIKYLGNGSITSNEYFTEITRRKTADTNAAQTQAAAAVATSAE